MKAQASKRFFQDLSNIRSLEVLDATEFIYDLANTCERPEDIPGFKWMTGYAGFGRITIGAYRIGVEVLEKTIIFRCVLHRSVVYKQFP